MHGCGLPLGRYRFTLAGKPALHAIQPAFLTFTVTDPQGRIHPPRQLTRAILRAFVLVAVAAVVAALASTARADGDPASDYLISQQVFFPLDAPFPADQQARLASVVEAANRSGFKIRVALIGSSYDMGSVTALYLKPRSYARFLGAELSFVYKQRLLVVMANGLGFNWPGHPAAPAYRILDRIPVQQGAAGFLATAQTAVQKLAAAEGVKLVAPNPVRGAGRGSSKGRLIIIAGVVAAILLAAAASFALRRRRREVG